MEELIKLDMEDDLHVVEHFGPYKISTVRLPLNHGLTNKPEDALWYETMVFKDESGWSDLDCERYKTKAEAVVGHRQMVHKWFSIAKHEDQSGCDIYDNDLPRKEAAIRALLNEDDVMFTVPLTVKQVSLIVRWWNSCESLPQSHKDSVAEYELAKRLSKLKFTNDFGKQKSGE